ncbi:Uncharacterised protein [Mycobacteroides abscessus subsp. abscessus]|nr:Uncharacterised protein [Mycobacteroides abscessus subsp. abscessus]
MLSSPPATPKVATPASRAPEPVTSRLSSTPAAMPDITSGNTIAPKAAPRGSSGSAATTSSTAPPCAPDGCWAIAVSCWATAGLAAEATRVRGAPSPVTIAP